MVMATTTSHLTVFSSSRPSPGYPPRSSLFHFHSRFKKGVSVERFVLLKSNCMRGSSKGTVGVELDSERILPLPLPLEHSSSSRSIVNGVQESSSVYKWCAALGGIGFLETAYLTYLKFIDSDASDVYGISLPLFGMLAYGFAAINGHPLHLGRKTAAGVEKNDVTMSFILFFATLKNFGLDKIGKKLASQFCTMLLVVALTGSYGFLQPVPSSLAETEMLPYVETEIKKESSPLALSLAKHLHSIGAKLYGAFWCSHCVDQKQMFGREAAKILDYVECFPDGVGKGSKMAKACYDVNLKGFPSWEINGQVLSGEKQFSELARISGIKLEDLHQN